MNTTSVLPASASLDTASPVRALTTALLRTDHSTAPLLMRLALASVMFPHGAQKLLGWFGGYGFTGSMGFFTGTMGIPWLFAFGAILIEFAAPLLLLLGVGTRLAAAAIGVVMSFAMILVQSKNGFFMNWFGNQKGEGIEYTLLLLGLVLALVVTGGGRWSVDRAMTKQA